MSSRGKPLKTNEDLEIGALDSPVSRLRRTCDKNPPEAGLDFAKVLRIVATFFEREDFAYAVIDAFGLHAYGLTRATANLDFVTDSHAQSKLVPFLEALGYETLHISAGYSSHLHGDAAMGRLDFVYVSGDTSQRLLGSAEKMLVLGDISLPVPRAEHLAAMKIQAMKNDPERTFQEMADSLFLLRVPGIDEKEVKGYFEKHGLIEKYHEIEKILKPS
jgi:hypothetical protein